MGIIGKSITSTDFAEMILNLMTTRIPWQRPYECVSLKSLFFIYIDNIHSAHADRRYCTVRNPYIFQYLIIMKCFTYLLINFLFVKMKQVSPQLTLLIPIPYIKETYGSQTLLFKHLKQPISDIL